MSGQGSLPLQPVGQVSGPLQPSARCRGGGPDSTRTKGLPTHVHTRGPGQAHAHAQSTEGIESLGECRLTSNRRVSARARIGVCAGVCVRLPALAYAAPTSSTSACWSSVCVQKRRRHRFHRRHQLSLHLRAPPCAAVVCVSECARPRARVCARACLWVRVSVRARVCGCVCLCTRVSVSACVCECMSADS